MSIAAVVITKNEERNIAACLDSLRWADELIVVDAESTDRTTAIARTFTESVHIRPWPGYGPQKNFGIEQARAEWILIVDADERVPSALQAEILTAVDRAAPDVAGWEIPRRNFFYGRWLQGGGIYPDYQLRLFRKSAGRYDDLLLHEHLNLNGRVERLTQPLEHDSVPKIQDHVRKMRRYTTLAAREKLKTRSEVTGLDVAFSHLATVFRTYVLRMGFRDGVHGLVLALFAGMHTFVKYAKAYEMVQVPPDEAERSVP